MFAPAGNEFKVIEATPELRAEVPRAIEPLRNVIVSPWVVKPCAALGDSVAVSVTCCPRLLIAGVGIRVRAVAIGAAVSAMEGDKLAA